jgi:hypothetical protein
MSHGKTKIVDIVLLDRGFEGPTAGEVEHMQNASKDGVAEIKSICRLDSDPARNWKNEQNVVLGPGLAHPIHRELENGYQH